MRVIIQPTAKRAGEWTAACDFPRSIHRHETASPKPFVLGLPTGSSPIPTYRRLVELNREGRVSFANVVTFNMDEYVGLPEDHPESYRSFMWKNLFSHVDIKHANTSISSTAARRTWKPSARATKRRSKRPVASICFSAESGRTGISRSMSRDRRWPRARASKR